MQLIFKPTTITANNTVGDTNLPNHVTGINVSMAWAEMAPAIRQAVQEFVIPFVGESLYNDLAQKYNAGTVLSSAQAQSLEYLQDAAGWYAIYHILPTKASALSSVGVVQNGPEGGASPTSQWAYVTKRLAALNSADSAMDRLLSFLDKQVKAGVAYFDLWKNDTSYSEKKSDFFRQVSDLDNYINIKRSFRSFISIIPYLKQVEGRYLKVLLCNTLYDAVLSASPTANNAKLIPYIREAVAYLGAAEALPHHRVVIDGDGFRFVSQTDGFEERRNTTNLQHTQAVGALLEQYRKIGQGALDNLRLFLEANIDDYPDYRDSSCRELKPNNTKTMYSSTDKIGMVGIL